MMCSVRHGVLKLSDRSAPAESSRGCARRRVRREQGQGEGVERAYERVERAYEGVERAKENCKGVRGD
eukprot:3297869-Rhodomonas_salina.1